MPSSRAGGLTDKVGDDIGRIEGKGFRRSGGHLLGRDRFSPKTEQPLGTAGQNEDLGCHEDSKRMVILIFYCFYYFRNPFSASMICPGIRPPALNRLLASLGPNSFYREKLAATGVPGRVESSRGVRHAIPHHEA